jgi:type VI secretion system protein ImpE
MTTAGDALRAGDVAGALAAATAAVKANPTDADARWLMAEMLLVTGDAERADKMLDAAALHEPNPAVLEFRKLLRAEVLRAQVLREGRAPKYQGDDATPAQQAALRARMLLRLSDTAGAAEAADQIESLRARTPGHLENPDGSQVTFDDLRDADDLWAAEIEVLTTAGDHILVPVERIRSLAFDPPRRTRDLLWRRCSIDLKDGTEGVVFLPTIYLGPERETDNALLLGRATDWTDPAQGPVRGRGLRMMLMGEELLPIISLHAVVFD